MADALGRRVHKITCRPQVVAAAALDSSGQPEVGPAASQPRPQWYTEQNCLVWTEVHKKATKPVPWAEGPGLSHRQPGGPAHRLLEGSAPNPGAPACRALALTADCGPLWSGVHAAHVAGVRHVAAASSPPPPPSVLISMRHQPRQIPRPWHLGATGEGHRVRTAPPSKHQLAFPVRSGAVITASD